MTRQARCEWCDVALPATVPPDEPAFCSETHRAKHEFRETSHAECQYEIKWLRAQLEAAQAVLEVARDAGRWGSGGNELARLTIALNEYGMFLGTAAHDPSRQIDRQEARAAVGLSTPLLDARR